jgi:hypothetical protein
VSFALDAVTMVHSTQVEAATKTQDLVLNAAQKFTDAVGALGGKAVPTAVTGPISTFTAPVANWLGTPAELASYVARSTHDWVGVDYRFRTALLEAFVPSLAPADN